MSYPSMYVKSNSITGRHNGRLGFLKAREMKGCFAVTAYETRSGVTRYADPHFVGKRKHLRPSPQTPSAKYRVIVTPKPLKKDMAPNAGADRSNAMKDRDIKSWANDAKGDKPDTIRNSIPSASTWFNPTTGRLYVAGGIIYDVGRARWLVMIHEQNVDQDLNDVFAYLPEEFLEEGRFLRTSA